MEFVNGVPSGKQKMGRQYSPQGYERQKSPPRDKARPRLHQETQRRLSQADPSSTASVKYAPFLGGGQDQPTRRPKPNAPSGRRQLLKGSLSLQPERI